MGVFLHYQIPKSKFVILMVGALGGILFPMLVGYLLDSYKLRDNLSGGYNLLFAIC